MAADRDGAMRLRRSEPAMTELLSAASRPSSTRNSSSSCATARRCSSCSSRRWIQIIAFGFALDIDVKHMAMVVFNEDRTAESRAACGAVREHARRSGWWAKWRAWRSWRRPSAAARRYVGLQIPPDFTRNLRAGRTAHMQVLIDGSNSTTALQALKPRWAWPSADSIEALLAAGGRRDCRWRCGRKCSTTRRCTARTSSCRA